jgi:hypothetical protein
MSHEPTDQSKARADFLAALRNTFGTPDGQRVLAWLHATAATRRPAFVPAAGGKPLDAIAAAYRDGRKSVVWEIEANLEAAELPPGDPADRPPTRPRARARV